MNALALQTTLAGVIIFIVSVPLAWRRVPMNWWYGFRIPSAFRSDQRWYEINEYGGRRMALGSLLIVACGVVGFLLPDSAVHVYRWATYLAALIGVGAPIVQTLVWSRRRNQA